MPARNDSAGSTLTGGPELEPEDAGGENAVVLRWVFPHAAETVLSAARTIVGRSRPSHTRLDSAQVSRQHAFLQLTAEGFVRICDLDSKNGMAVNGVSVEDALLVPGDVVRLGDFVGVLEVANAEPIVGFRDWGEGILGGQALQRTVRRARQVAPLDLPVVIEGQSGTGKERFARAVHAWSGRTGPFVAINCAVYSEGMAVGELFGYRKGAFTGADRAHEGHVRAADGGTLLLDEILELDADVQAKLLRAIEERTVLSLGETKAVQVDVRFIAASQSSLADAVSAGRFRADLRARLEGLTLELPAVAARRADVGPLLMAFIARHAAGNAPAVEARLIERACLYPWPLNVREIESVARRLVALHGDERTLKLRHLTDVLGPPPAAAPDDESTAACEADPLQARPASARDRIAAVLAECGGNQSRAAALLGMPRRTLVREIIRLDLPRPRPRRA